MPGGRIIKEHGAKVSRPPEPVEVHVLVVSLVVETDVVQAWDHTCFVPLADRVVVRRLVMIGILDKKARLVEFTGDGEVNSNFSDLVTFLFWPVDVGDTDAEGTLVAAETSLTEEFATFQGP